MIQHIDRILEGSIQSRDMAKKIKKKSGTQQLNTESHDHPGYASLIPRLKRAHGQVDAGERMIKEHAYCPDIIQQLRAATAAFKALEVVILRTHLEHCVNTAFHSKNKAESDQKMDELIQLFKRGG